jgi:hypothetical protein
METDQKSTSVRLLNAYQSNDFKTFAQITGDLAKSKERKPAAEQILELVSQGDFRLAESGLLGKARCKRMSFGLRLLRSMVHVAVRIATPEGIRFISFVEDELSVTCLASKFARWKV